MNIVGSLKYLHKITRNNLVILLAIFEDFRVPIYRLLFNSGIHWMFLLDFAIPQQIAKILKMICLFKGTSNPEFLLVLFGLVAIVVPDRYVFPSVIQLSCIYCQLVSNRLIWNLLKGRLPDLILN